MLLGIDAYRKYEPMRMLNLLTILSVCLLATVPTVLTVLAVPVLELELVFERTLTLQINESGCLFNKEAAIVLDV